MTTAADGLVSTSSAHMQKVWRVNEADQHLTQNILIFIVKDFENDLSSTSQLYVVLVYYSQSR